MALTAGTCTISSTTGAISGSGLALALANAWKTASDAYAAANPQPAGATAIIPMAISAPFVQPLCNQLASAILAHIAANAVVTVNVTTSTGGLQLTPNPNNPSTATLAPLSLVTIGGTVA